jgi:hypothetical protein
VHRPDHLARSDYVLGRPPLSSLLNAGQLACDLSFELIERRRA